MSVTRIYVFALIVVCICTYRSYSQNTYLQQGSDEYYLLKRLEAFSGNLSDKLFLTSPPVSRYDMVSFLLKEKGNVYENNLSNTDHFNINRALSISGEWIPPSGDGAVNSLYPIMNIFYRKESDLINFNKNRFFLAVNPVLTFQGINEFQRNSSNFKYNTAQGIELRGRINPYLGFYFLGTHNLDRPVSFFEERINERKAIPGVGNYNIFNQGYQYFLGRGYMDIGLIKDHVHLTVGYDRHFIGDGYRSLFLSDYSEGAAFARISTKIWKLNYQNLFLKLTPQSDFLEPGVRGNKYATIHYLGVNILRWLHVGLFESVTFSRNKGFEFGYLNPVIFYRAIERSMGSPDKVSIGINAKAIALQTLNVYGQFLLNEFTAKEFFGNNGYWANKWGAQLGFNYFNAFNVNNLDIQAEVNMVRPYTYQHSKRVDDLAMANYSHFNQELAHPLGAGFKEINACVKYQPIPRLNIHARAIYYVQGIDTGNVNYGNNIFDDYRQIPERYGVKMINGLKSDCIIYNLNLSYELRPRLYIETGGTYRKKNIENMFMPTQNTFYVYYGFRLNLERKDYAIF